MDCITGTQKDLNFYPMSSTHGGNYFKSRENILILQTDYLVGIILLIVHHFLINASVDLFI